MDTLNKSLRTPNNDPTQDLWNRYTTANALKNGQKEPTLPAYAHLLPSSPQTPSTASKDSGLRRTHSCGVEWPTSKAKRRRLEANELQSRTKELFAASRKEILRHDLPNNTRVGLLLEKIQESLTKKADTDESPSSSSPLPDRRSQVFVSPTKQPQVKYRQELPVPREMVQVSQQPVSSNPKNKRDVSSSSEFSDDGLDIEAFEKIELQVAQATQMNRPESAVDLNEESLPRGRYTSGSHTEIEAPHQPSQPGKQTETDNSEKPAQPQVQVHAASLEFDEFDDDEELMNEMIDLAAKYDSQPKALVNNNPSAPKSSPKKSLTPKRLETLDEFEDAFDDDDELWEGIANATSTKAAIGIGSKDDVRLG